MKHDPRKAEAQRQLAEGIARRLIGEKAPVPEIMARTGLSAERINQLATRRGA